MSQQRRGGREERGWLPWGVLEIPMIGCIWRTKIGGKPRPFCTFRPVPKCKWSRRGKLAGGLPRGGHGSERHPGHGPAGALYDSSKLTPPLTIWMCLGSLVHQSGLCKRITYSESFLTQVSPDPSTRYVFGRGSAKGAASRGAIIERTQRLGLLANKSWTEAEISNVRENYYLALKPFCAQFWRKFGYDRTRKTLQEQRRKQNPANAEN